MSRLLPLVFLLSLLTSCSVPLLPPATPEVPSHTIISFGVQDNELRIYEPLAARFNDENPDVQVTLVTLDQVLQSGRDLPPRERRTFRQRQIAQLADANTYPALFSDDMLRFQRDLTPFIAADPAFNSEDFVPTSLESLRDAEGRLYQLPGALVVRTLSFNRALFRARGIPEPQPDWTWQDVRRAAEQLADSAAGKPIYGLLTDPTGFDVLVALLAAQMQDKTKAIILEQPEALAALQEMVMLAQHHVVYVQYEGDIVLNAYEDLIRNGQVAMWTTGLLRLSTGGDATSTGTIPFFPLPYRNVSPQGGVAMSAGTSHPKETWRWLSFLSRQALPLDDGQETGVIIPVRQSHITRAGLWEQLGPEVSNAVRTTLQQKPDLNPYLTVVASDLTAPLQASLRDRIPAEQALSAHRNMLNATATAVAGLPAPTVEAEAISVATPVPARTGTAGTIVFGATDLDIADIRQQKRVFEEAKDVLVTFPPTTSNPTPSWAEQVRSTDCFAWNRPPLPEEAQAVRDLQPWLDVAGEDVSGSAPPAAGTVSLLYPVLSARAIPAATHVLYTVNGHLVGLPYTMQPRALFYDMSLALELGLPGNTTEWTLATLSDAALKATIPGQRYGIASRNMPADLHAWLEASGISLVRGQGAQARLTLTNPTTISALEAYLHLLQSASPHTRFVYGQPGIDSNATEQLISAGRVAFWFDQALNQTRATTIHGQQVTMAMAPFPKGPQGQRPIPIVSGLFIASASTQPEPCWSWIRFIEWRGAGSAASLATHAVDINTGEQLLAGFPEVDATTRAAPLVRGMPRAAQPGGGAIDYHWLYVAMDAALQGANLHQMLITAQQQSDQFSECFAHGQSANACAQQIEPGYEGWGAVMP